MRRYSNNNVIISIHCYIPCEPNDILIHIIHWNAYCLPDHTLTFHLTYCPT